MTVANLAPDQLNVRDAAGTQAQILGKLADGDTACVLGGVASADGYSWVQIRAAGGLSGWAALGDPADPAKPWLTAAGSSCGG